MIRLPFIVLVLAVASLAGVAPSPVLAQDGGPIIVGVVEVQTIMREAKAAQSIQAQLEDKRSEYQSELSAEESRLRELEAELERQRSVLSPEAYAERRREFESEVAVVQRTVQDRRRELDRAYAGGVRQLQEELTEIIGAVAEERGISLVLPDTQTLFVDQALSISQEVLARLDERVSEITLEFPSN